MAGSAVHPRDAEFLRLAKRAGRRARRAALFAAETALHAAPVAHDIVAKALAALSRSDLEAAQTLRGGLERVTSDLDERYLAAQTASPDAPGEVEETFSRARAANALLCALADDPIDAAVDSIYEAQASLQEAERDQFLEAAKGLLLQLQTHE